MRGWIEEMTYGTKLDPKSRELQEGMKQLTDDFDAHADAIVNQFARQSKMITEIYSRFRTTEAALVGVSLLLFGIL